MEECVMWGPDKTWKTKAKFYAWLRGGLRRSVWNKHPIKLNLKREQRYKAPIGKGGREVWAVVCNVCNTEVRESDSQVDHIHPAGSLNCLEDVTGFVERLAFITAEDLQLICKPCHGILTYMERYDKTWDEAKKRKEEIARGKNAAK